MSAHTFLLYFKLTNLNIKKQSDIQHVVDATYKTLNPYGFQLYDQAVKESFSDQCSLHLFVNSTGDHATLKAHRDGLITLDIHEYVSHNSNRIFNSEVVKQVEDSLKDQLSAVESKSLPAVRRGDGVEVYYPTVDGRIAEYDFVEVLREVQSRFQRVQVVRSESLGNVLVLDGDINMSEADLIYTHTLMQKGNINYSDKTCLILGGGDGGLLYEIVKEKPKMVVLVDIDEEVIKASRDLLPGVNGGILNEYKGKNYEIIIGDALEYMRNCSEKGQTFDYVIYDITAIPVTKQPLSSEWEFLEQAISLSLNVLSSMEHARFLCHSTALLAKESLEMFDGLLKRLNNRLEWLKHPAFVPSFHEVSVFYEIWLKS